MSYSIRRDEVVTYAPSALRSFHVHGFEWIDNLLFLRPPEEFIAAAAPEYVVVAKERFLEAGWEGDGEVALLWLPPFVFPLSMRIPPEGVIVWHVKQVEDGISFLLSPVPLPFEEFRS